MKKTSSTILGLVLVFIGVIFGLNALEITNIDIFFDGWWTLFIIIPSIIGFIKDDDKTGSLVGLVIGILLLLACQDLINFNIIWKLFIPLIIVSIGLKIIFGNFTSNKIDKEIKKVKKNDADLKSCCATFSEQNLNYDGEDFLGCELTSIFGSIKCDLTNSKIKEDVIINASCIFGGIDIYIPDNINVKVSSSSIFGGVENKKKNVSKDSDVTIYVYANCLFGGIDIK